MTRWKCLAAAWTVVLGGGPALAQYGLPIAKTPAARGPVDPKPVYKYELQPDHGEYLVFVKSFPGQYVGDKLVKEQAEGLAEYVRTECRLNAYIYERGWGKRQERRKELEAHLAAQKQYYEVERKMPIPEDLKKIKMARLADEYTVFVAPGKGSLKTYEEARVFADYVRKLKAPPADFCDSVVVGSGRDALKNAGELVNPFLTAMPGRNQAIPKAAAGVKAPKADEFLLRLNSAEDYSLVHKTKRAWTLVVKTYGGEPQVLKPGQTPSAGPTGVGERLERAAMQAHQLAELLRKMNSKFDAYVLHTPYNSIVCVGDFDKPDDAGMIALSEALASLPLTDKKKGEVLDTLNARPLPTMIPKP